MKITLSIQNENVPFPTASNPAQQLRNRQVLKARKSGANLTTNIGIQVAILLHMITAFPGAREMIRSPYRLLQSGNSSAKLRKGETAIYGMAVPQYKAWFRGKYLGNVCPKAKGCTLSCIGKTGRYGIGATAARMWTRVLWHTNRELFLTLLNFELADLNAKAANAIGNVAVRLNVTSDIRWERYIDMSLYPEIQFYDYSKWSPLDRKDIAQTYDMTYSVSEDYSVNDIVTAIANGHRLAMIVPTKNDANVTSITIGDTVIPCVNGDKSDERFLEPTGVIVLLRVKRVTSKDRNQDDIYNGGMVRDNKTLEIIWAR